MEGEGGRCEGSFVGGVEWRVKGVRCEGSFVGGVDWRVKGVGVRVHLWEG